VSDDGIRVITMGGELDLNRRTEIRETLRVDTHGAPILVDLSHVTYADSSILAELLRFSNEASAHGVAVALVIVARQFARLVQYAGLADAFMIYNSVDEARSHLLAGTEK